MGCRTTGIKYNETTVSAWFDYDCVVVPNASKTACKGAGRHQASNSVLCSPCANLVALRERLLLCRRQVHFDNNHTLTLKLQALRKAGARGVAWWHTGSVDYAAADNQAATFWDAMSAFAGPK